MEWEVINLKTLYAYNPGHKQEGAEGLGAGRGGREAVNGGNKRRKKTKNPGNLTTSVTFIYFHVHISKGQWQTGTKTKPVNWNSVTDQKENFPAELLGLGLVLMPIFRWCTLD